MAKYLIRLPTKPVAAKRRCLLSGMDTTRTLSSQGMRKVIAKSRQSSQISSLGFLASNATTPTTMNRYILMVTSM
eukprot:7746540-Karenia_brevis.AAC.1